MLEEDMGGRDQGLSLVRLFHHLQLRLPSTRPDSQRQCREILLTPNHYYMYVHLSGRSKSVSGRLWISSSIFINQFVRV